VARYLADTSAWQWSGRVADRWEALLEDDELAICTPVALELLYSARSPDDYITLAADLDGLFFVAFDNRTGATARETQARLAARSQHRGATPVDIVVAALAQTHGLTVLHYDHHFDAIAGVTGQPSEWLARRGTLR
jgi:predicted nucleic acid-binding protein